MITLTPPITEEQARSLKSGDVVKINGIIYTARDRAHQFLLEEAEPETLPINLDGGVIYHCGPVVQKEGDEWKVVVAGPTTSARMNPYTPKVLEKYHPRLIVGKAGMDDDVQEALAKNGAVYGAATSGAAVVLAKTIKKVHSGYKQEEFGTPECFWELEVEGFEVIITMDSHGNSLHKEILAKSKAKRDELISKK